MRGFSLVPGLAFHGSTYNVYSLGINFHNEPMRPSPTLPNHSLPTKAQLIIDMLKQEVRKLEWAQMPLHGATMCGVDDLELTSRACQSPPHMTHPRQPPCPAHHPVHKPHPLALTPTRCPRTLVCKVDRCARSCAR
jgi:hypothetical protein